MIHNLETSQNNSSKHNIYLKEEFEICNLFCKLITLKVYFVMYTDFAKAFNKCETNVLLHTLKQCGVKGKIGLWLAAFLDPLSRKQEVGVEGRISPLVPVVSGVPQGTVLGPILFLVHIRGINLDLSQGTSASSFADDTRVVRVQIWIVRHCKLILAPSTDGLMKSTWSSTGPKLNG